MKKTNSRDHWLNAGYELFAEEGPQGIQVERLARILDLNKSGFYHYFGEIENFLEAWMDIHHRHAVALRDEMNRVQQVDPEFIQALVNFKTSIMFHYQLVRNKHVKLLKDTYEHVNELIDPVNVRLFADFIGFKDRATFAAKYYGQVRDMFYIQINRERMNFDFIRKFLYEARDVINDAIALASQAR